MRLPKKPLPEQISRFGLREGALVYYYSYGYDSGNHMSPAWASAKISLAVLPRKCTGRLKREDDDTALAVVVVIRDDIHGRAANMAAYDGAIHPNAPR